MKFAKYILSKFFALLPNNPTLYAELIFWKSPAECHEITEGYGSLANRYYLRANCVRSVQTYGWLYMSVQ